MNATEFIKYAGMFAAGAYAQHKYAEHHVFRDPGFLSILDAALVDTDAAERDKLVRLSPDRLRDWAMAPPQLRRPLLVKWAEDDATHKSPVDQVMLGIMGVNSFDEAEKKVSRMQADLKLRKAKGFWQREWGGIKVHRIVFWVLVVVTIAMYVHIFVIGRPLPT